MQNKNILWNFKGKSILITGAGGSIGNCILNSFLGAGAEVSAPSHADMDLSKETCIYQYFDRNKRQIDIFIHCAGINPHLSAEQIHADILNEVFQINACSAALIVKQIIPYMKKRGWGRILLISSLYAVVSRERRMAYSMSKNALTGMAKTLSLELASYNILTNCVAPGYVMTDMTRRNLSDNEINEITADIPTGRLQSGQEIADIALFLCSDYNQSITGQVIAVDGGFTCK